MQIDDESGVEQLLARLVEAWNRADARAFGERYRSDGTFTNVDGSFFVGREAFDARHEEIFTGYLQGTALELTTRSLRSLRPGVAVVDADLRLSGMNAPPPPRTYVDPGGGVHTCLLMVLVKEDGDWWITAYHNVWRSVSASIGSPTGSPA